MDLCSLTFKEFRMITNDQNMNGSEQVHGKVSLEVLAKLTGFPVELIKEELFNGEISEQVSMEALRSAMLTFIDSTILLND
jgi:hypothetical protein